ncbi:MAG: hypothetical protein Q8O40_00190, partial [Chloroflexota bacterium]|nr:hypothetical protein [Chloroflexota bacterium]
KTLFQVFLAALPQGRANLTLVASKLGMMGKRIPCAVSSSAEGDRQAPSAGIILAQFTSLLNVILLSCWAAPRPSFCTGAFRPRF